MYMWFKRWLGSEALLMLYYAEKVVFIYVHLFLANFIQLVRLDVGVHPLYYIILKKMYINVHVVGKVSKHQIKK